MLGELGNRDREWQLVSMLKSARRRPIFPHYVRLYLDTRDRRRFCNDSSIPRLDYPELSAYSTMMYIPYLDYFSLILLHRSSTWDESRNYGRHGL